jgi:hypothetical protein
MKRASRSSGQRYGPSHVRVASSLVALSAPLVQLGQLDRSEAMLREALAIDDAVLDRSDHRRAMHLNALMFLLREKQDYAGALELSRESLRIARAAFGNEHPRWPVSQCRRILSRRARSVS